MRDQRFLRMIRARTARVAVSASASRGQGAPGIVKRAREFCSTLDLGPFGTNDQRAFARRLEATTQQLRRRLPTNGASWGLARKLLNIFLRDSLYTSYLARAYGLHNAERWFEIPLDSITAGKIRKEASELPRWPGVKYLTPNLSAAYQTAASAIAKSHHVARVQLDAFWWGLRE